MMLRFLSPLWNPAMIKLIRCDFLQIPTPAMRWLLLLVLSCALLSPPAAARPPHRSDIYLYFCQASLPTKDLSFDATWLTDSCGWHEKPLPSLHSFWRMWSKDCLYSLFFSVRQCTVDALFFIMQINRNAYYNLDHTLLHSKACMKAAVPQQLNLYPASESISALTFNATKKLPFTVSLTWLPWPRRQKRVSDQRLAELETLLALAKMKNRKYVTLPVGFGLIDVQQMWVRLCSLGILSAFFNSFWSDCVVQQCKMMLMIIGYGSMINCILFEKSKRE